MDWGIDQDNDGILDDDEVTESTEFCGGVDGYNTVLSTSTLAPGTECPGGGLSVRSGRDLNRDSMLSDDELETEQFLCHGESTLVYAQEDATICNGLGGIVFRTGIDANDDSTISEIESIHEVTACNGASGLTTLTETASASFRDCPDGGYLLKMGLDTNQNQTLENNELIA